MGIILERALDSSIDAVRKVFNVAVVQTSHRNSSVGGHIDMRLLSQVFGLW